MKNVLDKMKLKDSMNLANQCWSVQCAAFIHILHPKPKNAKYKYVHKLGRYQLNLSIVKRERGRIYFFFNQKSDIQKGISEVP